MIQISVNNNSQSVAKETSVAALLKTINQSENGIAIAINDQVIPKARWKTKILNNQDKLLIITATQGG